MSARAAALVALTLCASFSPDRLVAQSPSPMPSVSLPQDLERILRDYEQEWSRRSAPGLAELFTDDGFVLQPGRPPVRGRTGITGAYQGSGGSLALRALAYAVSDSLGYIIGAYASVAGEPDIGKFILLVRRTPGAPWKIAADMDNGNRGR